MAKNSEDYQEYIREQLSAFGEFEFKKMFGSIGIFSNGYSFGGIMENVFRLKVDDHNRADYEEYDMGPWQVPNKKMKMSYYEVPQEILEDKKQLKKWAQKAYDAAVRAKAKKKKKSTK